MNAHVESRSNEGDAAASSIDSAGQENQKQAKIDRDGRSPLGQSPDPYFAPPQPTSLAARLGGKPLFFL
jgi:hypothetical protein